MPCMGAKTSEMDAASEAAAIPAAEGPGDDGRSVSRVVNDEELELQHGSTVKDSWRQ